MIQKLKFLYTITKCTCTRNPCPPSLTCRRKHKSKEQALGQDALNSNWNYYTLQGDAPSWNYLLFLYFTLCWYSTSKRCKAILKGYENKTASACMLFLSKNTWAVLRYKQSIKSLPETFWRSSQLICSHHVHIKLPGFFFPRHVRMRTVTVYRTVITHWKARLRLCKLSSLTRS